MPDKMQIFKAAGAAWYEHLPVGCKMQEEWICEEDFFGDG